MPWHNRCVYLSTFIGNIVLLDNLMISIRYPLTLYSYIVLQHESRNKTNCELHKQTENLTDKHYRATSLKYPDMEPSRKRPLVAGSPSSMYPQISVH